MKKETEDRLAYSLAGGAVIPATFFLLMMYLPGKLTLYAGLPLSLPVLVYDYLFPEPVGLDPMFAGLSHLSSGFLVFVMVGNITLYSLLTYLGLCWKQRMPRLR